MARLVALQQPREPECYLQLGDAWVAFGEPHEAIAAYERATQLRPQSARALRSLATASRSAEALQRVIQIAPGDAASWYQSARLAGQSRKCRRRLPSIRTCVEPTLLWRGLRPPPVRGIKPKRRCEKLCASACTTRRRGMWRAGRWRRRASFPRPYSISKKQFTTGPALRRISTNMP